MTKKNKQTNVGGEKIVIVPKLQSYSSLYCFETESFKKVEPGTVLISIAGAKFTGNEVKDIIFKNTWIAGEGERELYYNDLEEFCINRYVTKRLHLNSVLAYSNNELFKFGYISGFKVMDITTSFKTYFIYKQDLNLLISLQKQ